MEMGSVKKLWGGVLLCMYGCTPLFASQEKSDQLFQGEDVKNVIDTVLALPKLGKTGIILFLVAAVVAFGLWWWWNNYNKKITKRENDRRRTEDQASNKTDNQDITDEWDEAADRVEDIKEGLSTDQPKKPRPDRPE